MRSPSTTNIIGRKTNRKADFSSIRNETVEHGHMDKRYGRREFEDKRSNSKYWNHGGKKSQSEYQQNLSEKDEFTKKSFVTPVILTRVHNKQDPPQSTSIPQSQPEEKSNEVSGCRKQIQFVSKPKEVSLLPEHVMKTTSKILDDSLDISVNFNQFLLDQSQFLTVAVVGCQGSGKSTIASFLADPLNATKPLIFRPESKDEIFRGIHCTVGVDAYITKERVIILDFQPLLAPSVVDFVANQDRKIASDISSTVNMVEIESIQMLTLAMSVSHVLMVVQDLPTQASMSRFLGTCSMMTPTYGSSGNIRESNQGRFSNTAHYLPHLVFVHNRMAPHHFSPSSVKDLQAVYYNSLLDSGFFMFNPPVSTFNPETGSHQVNSFFLPDFENQENCPVSFFDSIQEMRRQVLSLSRQQISTVATTEKSWYQFTCRTWETIRKSKLFAEYNHTLP